MLAQVRGVQPRLPAVGGVREGEQPGEVAVALPRLRQQHDAGAVQQGDLAAGDGLHAEAACETGELQRAAEVGVGEREGVVAVRLRLRQQLMCMRCAPSPKE